MNKKGVMLFYITAFFIIIALLVVASIGIPLGKQYGEDSFTAGSEILEDVQLKINSIENSSDKSELSTKVQEAINSKDSNIELSNQYYQYGVWIIIILTVVTITIVAKAFYSR